MAFTCDRPPTAECAISAIVPFVQSGPELTSVVEGLVAQLDRRHRDYEILLVSTADGGDAVKDVTTRFPRVRHLTPEKPGYGTALRTGVAAAQYPLVLFMPGTGEYDPADVPKLLEEMEGVDIVCGYRPGRTWLTRLREWFWPWAIFGLRLQDARCPVRLARRSLFQRIPIQSDGLFADVEILAKANFLIQDAAEVEVSWKPAAEPPFAGGSRFADARRVFSAPSFGPAKLEEAKPAASL